MPSLKIVLLGFCAAVGYGILHDQVTARVCVEYFTVGHPRIIASWVPVSIAMGYEQLGDLFVRRRRQSPRQRRKLLGRKPDSALCWLRLYDRCRWQRRLSLSKFRMHKDAR